MTLCEVLHLVFCLNISTLAKTKFSDELRICHKTLHSFVILLLFTLYTLNYMVNPLLLIIIAPTCHAQLMIFLDLCVQLCSLVEKRMVVLSSCLVCR